MAVWVGTSASRPRIDLPNLGTRCQYWGVHLLADLGQICQIYCQLSGSGGTSAGRSRVDLQHLATRCQYRGETSAGRSRVDLPNLGTRCQYKVVQLPADVGQFCQFWPPDTSTGDTSASRSRVDLPNLATSSTEGTSADRSRADLQNLATRCQYWGTSASRQGQICQIWSPDTRTEGTSAGRSRVDLPMCTPTSIFHVKLGKYDLSELKSFILIWGVFWRVFWGVKRMLHLT